MGCPWSRPCSVIRGDGTDDLDTIEASLIYSHCRDLFCDSTRSLIHRVISSRSIRLSDWTGETRINSFCTLTLEAVRHYAHIIKLHRWCRAATAFTGWGLRYEGLVSVYKRLTAIKPPLLARHITKALAKLWQIDPSINQSYRRIRTWT